MLVAGSIADRYTLEREIGRGGMGAVWLGRDEVLGRDVALKRVGMGPGGSEPDLDRAEREARLAARLNHPHVVAVYDLVIDDGNRWLVMEHVPGETLATLVRREGALSPDRAAELLHQVADALAAAHGAGIVHRDVKPSNILVGADGQVKLSDFGIARAQADASLTQTGLVTGSPAYLAPEVASGQQATAASDVWSLGATLFHALSGHPPYEVGDNVLGALYRIVHEEPPRVGAAAGWLAPALDATMAVPVERRWSMAQVRDFLADAQAPLTAPVPVPVPVTDPPATPPPRPPDDDGTRTLAPAAPPPQPPPSLPARSRWPLLLAAAAAAAIVVLGVAWWLGNGDEQPEDPTGQRTPGAGSSTPAPDPAEDEVTPAGMEEFVAAYLGTVTSDPQAAWQQLTPSFQDESGNFGKYQRFWRGIDSATLVSAEADPETKQITYEVEYVHSNGRRSTDEVTLLLDGVDGDYLIAGEN